MQEDYIEDEFLEDESSSGRRPFLIAVGVLVSLFILMGVCTTFFLLRNRAADAINTERIAIETRNGATEATNVAVRVAATETVAAMPTNTKEPTAAATDTPVPSTLTPTSTPVVGDNAEASIESADDGEDAENSNADTAASGDGTGTDGDGENSDGTTGGKDGGDVTPTPISALVQTGDNSSDALPQTGLDSWGIVVAAFVFVGLLILARRLRAAG